MNKWNRRTVASFTALTLLALPTTSLAADITVHVDGQVQQYDVAPYLKNNNAQVPLRGIAESLGATVKWEEETGTITVTKGERSIALQLGSRTVRVNGQQGQLQALPEVLNDRVMVHWELFHAFGADVRWDSLGNTLRILSEERKDKTLNLMISDEVPTMDSAVAPDINGLTLIQQTGEGLLRHDQSGRLSPGVAESWKISSDGLTYTFQLRKDAKWSDGSKVTATDFEYAWKRALNPKTAAQWAFQLFAIEHASDFNEGKGAAADVGVSAIDDVTLQVKLAKPLAYFTDLLTGPIFYPQKQSFVEAAGDRYGADAETTISNGPFKLAAWTHEQSLRLEKNEQYWDRENVALQQVNYVVNRTAELNNTLFNDGVIDRMPLTPQNYENLNGAPLFSVAPRNTVYYLNFNMKGPKVLQNAKVRRALAYAVNGQALSDIVYHDGTVGANGLVPFGVTDPQGRDFREQGGDLMRRDLNQPNVKALLEQGLKELGLTEFPHLKLLSRDSLTHKRETEFIREEWRKNLGIDVEVETLPFKFLLQRTYQHDYDITVSGWTGDYNDPLTFLDLFTTGSDTYNNGYSRKEYDQLITEAKQATINTDARTTLLHNAEKILIDDMAIAPLYFKRDAFMTRPYVQGWNNQAQGAQYDLKYVHIEGRH